MNMTLEDSQLPAELCEQHGVSADKVLKLLDAVRDYEFKDRRTGVFDALREILMSIPTTIERLEKAGISFLACKEIVFPRLVDPMRD